MIANAQPAGFKGDFVNPVTEVDKTIVHAVETFHDKAQGAVKIVNFFKLSINSFKRNGDSHSCEVLKNAITSMERTMQMFS